MNTNRKLAILSIVIFWTLSVRGTVDPGNATWALKMGKASEDYHELRVWIELRDGVPSAGYATTLSTSEMVSPIDVSSLVYENEKLSGALGLSYIRDMSYRRVRTYEGVYSIDLGIQGESVTGSHSGTFDETARSGTVRGRIEETSSIPSSFHCDLWLDAPFRYDGHRQMRPMFQLVIREGEISDYSFQEAELYQATGDISLMFRLASGGLGTVRGAKEYVVDDVAFSTTDTSLIVEFNTEATHDGITRSYAYQINGEVVGNSIVGETRVESEGEER